MIETQKKHIEEMKLSDKRQQPFERSATRDMVFKFNGKNQKQVKSKRKRK